MSEIFKKLLLMKETPFLSKIVYFRHKIARISEWKAHSQKPQDTCLIICHKEVFPADLANSRTRTPDHLLVSSLQGKICYTVSFREEEGGAKYIKSYFSSSITKKHAGRRKKVSWYINNLQNPNSRGMRVLRRRESHADGHEKASW